MSAPVAGLLADANLLVKAEYRTPWGVCDFVGVELDADRARDRRELGQARPIGPPQRIGLLQQIPDIEDGQSVSFDALRKRWRHLMKSSELREELARLLAGRFVRCEEPNRYQKINGWAPLHRRIVAVEVKLERVADVFRQATANLSFADESYVALPMGLARQAAESRGAAPPESREAMVGVIGVGLDACEVLVPARTTAGVANAVLQGHCVERFWPDYLRADTAASTAAQLRLAL